MNNAIISDDVLYAQFLKGDTTSYDKLMIRYGNSLTVYLYGYLKDWQEAEDLMIESFARMMVKKPSVRPGNFKAYLFKTARNLSSRYHTRKTRLKTFSMEELTVETADQTLVEEMIVDQERNEVLHLCLERIDPELKEALWLVYMEDMSYAQAAEVMGVKIKRIDHLLTRGKAHMRRELEKEGVTNAFE